MKRYDAIVIGMGPAGMAVTAMGSAMGLDILTIEANKVGGECLNIGCIPSKGILKAAESLHTARNLNKYGFTSSLKLINSNPLEVVRDNVKAINNKKLMKSFEKAELIKGYAEFVDSHTVKVNDTLYKAKRIYIGTGTRPFIPPIEGIDKIKYLTNENIFELKTTPKSMTIIGGGAIGTEMAQAFSRLGSKVTIVHMDKHLIPIGDHEAGLLLENELKKEGIQIYNSTKIEKVEEIDGKINLHTEAGIFSSEELLVAAGRKAVFENLNLKAAGVISEKNRIPVDSRMRTNKKNIYAIGDINGLAQLSHAAMHQGMMALMDGVSPFSFAKLKHKNYALPWSVFTSPEIAQVGMTEKQAKDKGINFQITKKDYIAYGLTVSVGRPEGFIKVVHSKKGKIYGVTIVGENASELINEWTLAIQKKIRLHDIMMTMHAFPSFSMMNKMVTEDWMMGIMNNDRLRRLIKWLY